jgi:Histidine kinase-, DNA gyrase B-, and HSP90-like ATPase
MALTARKLGEDNLTFKVKPRLLMLLGDQLIRDANLAVFELVKNAYDADATECSVTVKQPDDPSDARIEVRDNGSGMDEQTIRDTWMVIATDFRALQRQGGTRSRKFHRFPLGEKGLGRLSVHKLGRSIRMVTRVRGGEELVLQFDWDKLENATELDRAFVRLSAREPRSFPGSKHGTRIVITRLREQWTRGELRRLHRAVNSLCSPFKGPSDFEVALSAPGHEDWLEKMVTAETAKESALYHISGSLEGKTASFSYTFIPPPGHSKQLRKREHHLSKIPLERRKGRSVDLIDLSKHSIGEVEFDFLLFDRDPSVLRAVTDDVKGLKGTSKNSDLREFVRV